MPFECRFLKLNFVHGSPSPLSRLSEAKFNQDALARYALIFTLHGRGVAILRRIFYP